jgi:hypothetical protein
MKNGFLPLTFIVCALAVSLALSADYQLERHQLERFQQQILQLNTFCAGHEKMAAELSRLIDIDPILTQKAIENEKCKAFGVVAAYLIAQKTHRAFADVLANRQSTDWTKELRKNGISRNEAAEFLEKVNSELASAAMSGSSKKLRPENQASKSRSAL